LSFDKIDVTSFTRQNRCGMENGVGPYRILKFLPRLLCTQKPKKPFKNLYKNLKPKNLFKTFVFFQPCAIQYVMGRSLWRKRDRAMLQELRRARVAYEQ